MAWYDKVNSTFIRNVAVAYFQEKSFDPFSIFPAVTVNKDTGHIATYDKADWLRIGNLNDYKTTGAVESVGDTYATGKAQYLVEKYRFHVDVTEDEVANADAPFEPVADATRLVVDRLERVLTYNFVQKFMQGGIWANDVVGGTDFTKWSDATSKPIEDVFNWKQMVLKVTGFEPNRMAISYDVYMALRGNANIKDQLKVTDDKVVTTDKLAKLFDLEDLRVMRTVMTTAKKGKAATSANTDFMASGSALLVYAPSRPSTRVPSGGYHIIARRQGKPVSTKRIPMPQLDNALRVEGKVMVDAKVVASDMGVFASSVI